MYSGSKDGTVNIWNLAAPADQPGQNIRSLGLAQVGTLQGQGSPVTAIAALDPQYGNAIIYGSMDKSLRVCKRQDYEEEDIYYNDLLNEHPSGNSPYKMSNN